MVEYHVHHDLQSLAVSLVDELFVFGIGTEARIHTIVVGGGISMIGAIALFVVGRVVFENRSKPKSRHTQLVEIVEMLAYALKVATMSETRLGTVLHIVAHPLDSLVMMRALCEAVGHEHIQDVGIGEPNALFPTLLTFSEFVSYLLLVEFQGHRARLSPTEVEVYQQVIGRVKAYYAINHHTGIVGSDILHLGNILAIYHQLKRWIFHASIPVGRIYTINLSSRTHSHSTHKHTENE